MEKVKLRKELIVIILVLLLAGVLVVKGIFSAERKVGENRDLSRLGFSQENLQDGSNKDIETPAANVEVKKPEEILPENGVAKETVFSFAILGDTQYFESGSGGGYQMAVEKIKKLNPELVFSAGDLVSSCDETNECTKKFAAWKNVLGPLASKTYVTQGNHDRTGGDKADAAWEKVFSYLPTNGPQDFVGFVYSFDFGNSHFVVLDSDKPKENNIKPAQLDWLESDLAANKKENVFVFFHEPAYPTNSKIAESLDENPENRDRLWNILTEHKVKAVFSGHEHIQSRRKVNGLYQFVFGNTDSFNHLPPRAGMAEYSFIGEAFGVVKVNGSEISVETYSVQGDLLDTFRLSN